MDSLDVQCVLIAVFEGACVGRISIGEKLDECAHLSVFLPLRNYLSLALSF
ncbi:hypothetical protein D3C79_461390 [compost metagenome]